MITFEELGIEASLLQSIKDLGFETPTPIQEKAIPILLSGTKDFVGLAQTGTGKTAAFGLPLLQLVKKNEKFPQALIICPTRELCMQITRDLDTFKTHTPGLAVTPVYGGTSISMQIRDLKRGTHIVVATPGRLIDLIERKAIDLTQIHYIVLDEADEMLNMGFREDIEHVLKYTPNRQSTWLFSATMPPEVKQVAKRYMESPAEVTIGKVNAANANIDHHFYMTSHHNRYETLKRLVDFNPGIYGIIFTRTKADAQGITEALIREGYDIEALHGDLTQQQRDKVMVRFREKNIQLLIATDVAARGLDIKEISHVINYELPDDIEVYTHRSGRTGRAGHHGISISLVTPKESFRIKLIEKLINTKFHKMDIPSGNDVCRKQFFSFIDKMMTTDISHGEYETYLPIMAEKFADVSKEEILQRVAGMEFNRFLQYYENAADLNARDDRRSSEPRGQARGNVRDSRDARPQGNRDGGNREAGGRTRVEYTDTQGRDFSKNEGGGNFQRIFVNLGTKDGFYKASFLQFILDMSDLKKDNLGKIDMKDMNSWIEVEPALGEQMIKSIDGKMYKGRKIRMNDAQTGGNKNGWE